MADTINTALQIGPTPTVAITSNYDLAANQYSYVIGSTTYAPTGAYWFDSATPIAFTATVTSTWASSGSQQEIKWDFGDGGNTFSVISYSGGNSSTVTYTYRTPGVYQLVLRLISPKNEQAFIRRTIYVRQKLNVVASPFNVVIAQT